MLCKSVEDSNYFTLKSLLRVSVGIPSLMLMEMGEKINFGAEV